LLRRSSAAVPETNVSPCLRRSSVCLVLGGGFWKTEKRGDSDVLMPANFAVCRAEEVGVGVRGGEGEEVSWSVAEA